LGVRCHLASLARGNVTLFGILLVLAFFGWLATLPHTYFTDPRARTASPPLHLLFSLVGVVFVGMFLVGVSIPSIGRVT
jgi:hypothetical protein